MKKCYFAASNSSEGFYSYYNEIFDVSKYSSIYVIKGGSGTGKSFFMKRVAERAESMGMAVEYIYCSSDADSLDGIIIPRPGIAILDGTAPHVYEPRTVGAVESIVNLGEFLNEKMLRSARKIIEDLMGKKQDGFSRAYSYLAAYTELGKNLDKLTGETVKFDKIEKFVSRFTSETRGEGGREEHLLVRSVGMRGARSFDTYRSLGDIFYEINDFSETAHFLVEKMRSAFISHGYDIYISSNPIERKKADAIAVPELGLAFEICTGGESARTINMKRFVDTDKISSLRAEIRGIQKARADVLSLALGEFEKIKRYHFILEEIYGSAMNFDAKEEFTERFCNKIFENN